MLVERVHNVFDLLADQQRRTVSVPAGAPVLLTSARAKRLIASGALSVAPQAGRALFSCSAHDVHAPHRPWAKAPMRGTVKAKYILG